MGKQVGFFMTSADERMFLSAIEVQFGPLVVVLNTSKAEHEQLDRLEQVGADTANLSIVRTYDLEQIVSTYIPEQKVFCVDLLNSNVVQFNRCRQLDGWLSPGRLWFEERSNEGRKSAAFRSWANSLLAWVKKHYVSSHDGAHFVGPDAEKESAKGALKLGPPREGMCPEEIKKRLGLT